MKKIFYRFRSAERLLDKAGSFTELDEQGELSSQTIFFASPSSLNDPMEGFRDFYWDGDVVVWKNFFRNYLICLDDSLKNMFFFGENVDLSEKGIFVFKKYKDLENNIVKSMIDNVFKSFFDNKYVDELIPLIVSRSTKIRRDELLYYLNAIHFFAIDIILTEYEKNGLPVRISNPPNSDSTLRKLIDERYIQKIEEILSTEKLDGHKFLNTLFSTQITMTAQLAFINYYNGTVDHKSKNKKLVFIDFPEKYLTSLEKIIYPNWYTACFMSGCSNSSVWGSYGNNHQGVCMMFQTDDKGFLGLNTRVGYSNGPIYGDSPFKFHKVNYLEGFGEIDFFRSLGKLSIPDLNAMWYRDPDDRSNSICAEEMNEDISKWRDKYWDGFYRDITIKSKDWEFEKEHRLILNGDQIGDGEPAHVRALKYEFSSLKGLIFGIKTKVEDKINIMKIIESKCRENNISDFHQAYYSHEKKEIFHYKLDLLKFKFFEKTDQ